MAASMGVLLALASAAFADSIAINRLTIPNVRITGIASGEIEYLSAGRTQSRSLEDVTSISLSRYDSYATAVEMIESQPARAAEQFRTLSNAVREDFLKPLINLRLSQALDASGDLPGALRAWAEAVRDDNSAYFVSRIPSTMPDTQTQRREAAAVARGLAGRVPGDDARAALNSLAQRLAADAASPTAGSPDAAAVEPESVGSAATEPALAPEVAADVDTRVSAMLSSIQSLVEQGNYRLATERIEQVARDAGPQAMAVLDFQRGRIARGEDRSIDAAAWFLRAALLYDAPSLAGDALAGAASAFEAAGANEAALATWRKALTRAQSPADQRAIGARINALEK